MGSGNERLTIAVVRDITERKAREEALWFRSTHDELTGLYKRAFFEAEKDRLARSRQFPVGVIIADVDGLKATNDGQGHGAGDALLRKTAKILGESFRSEDVVARIGGEESESIHGLRKRKLVRLQCGRTRERSPGRRVRVG
jgi:GGDEF domain-containing protein